MDFATVLDEIIKAGIGQHILEWKQVAVEDVPDDAFIASETIGEVIDKLVILNIRIWHLEDRVSGATDAELLDLQRKLRHCFRTKRPRLVAALNQMLRAALLDVRIDLVDDEDVKVYKEKS